jgi:hypothetical protein
LNFVKLLVTAVVLKVKTDWDPMEIHKAAIDWFRKSNNRKSEAFEK